MRAGNRVFEAGLVYRSLIQVYKRGLLSSPAMITSKKLGAPGAVRWTMSRSVRAPLFAPIYLAV